MKIYLARDRGFCSGVKRSIRLAYKTLEETKPPVYILNDIVHNKTVVKELKEAGLIKISDQDDAISGTLIISAHGVPENVIADAEAKNLNVVDTTCPLVKRIHDVARNFANDGLAVILFGDPDHDEVKGIKAVAPEKIHVIKSDQDLDKLPDFKSRVALISQSTCSIRQFEKIASTLQEKYPHLIINNTICRATRLRQEAAHKLAELSDLIIVLGSASSANANRLAEIAGSCSKPAHLIENAGEFELEWLNGIKTLGVTASASTPEFLVEELLNKLKKYYEDKKIEIEITAI